MNAKFGRLVCDHLHAVDDPPVETVASFDDFDQPPPTPQYDLDDWTKGFIAGCLIVALIWMTVSVYFAEWGL